jgi:hypothetical protein
VVYAHVIGRGYEYRVKEWFIKRGWKSERNPLSGASDQIEQELGKHDVRSWHEDKNIFLQIECKKTSTDENILGIKKEWIDKIDFNNDEFIVFSFQNCRQHFCFMPKDIAEKILGKTKLVPMKTHVADGDKIFGFKREWLEGKNKEIFVVDFLGSTWYALDLEEFIDARERYGGPTNATSFGDKIKIIHDVKKLKDLYAKEESKLTTRDKRLYYGKLERLESGDTNAYNPEFIKEGQWWLDESKKFDADKNLVTKLVEAFDEWLNDVLIEDKKSGRFYLNDDFDQGKLEKKIKKLLGLDKKK